MRPDGETADALDAAGGDRALRELALRLVPSPSGPGGPSTAKPMLWPGKLPEVLPFDLPVPDAGRVIGSYGRGEHLTILIDTEMTPKETVAFYEERLPASGWSTPAWYRRQGGFFPPQVGQPTQILFCRGAEGPALAIFAEQGPDRITHATLSLNLDPAENPCRPPADDGRRVMRVGPHIPPLEAPPNCVLIPYGTSAGPDISTALAALSVDLVPGAIEEHFGRQLAEAGWRLVERGASGPIAWSTWSFVDRDRSAARGMLTVIREPGAESGYALSLYARLDPSPSQNGA